MLGLFITFIVASSRSVRTVHNRRGARIAAKVSARPGGSSMRAHVGADIRPLQRLRDALAAASTPRWGFAADHP
jgi:hypothetical protein